jgi:hypothetical protein
MHVKLCHLYVGSYLQSPFLCTLSAVCRAIQSLLLPPTRFTCSTSLCHSIHLQPFTDCLLPGLLHANHINPNLTMSSTSEEEYEKAGWGSSTKNTPPDDTPNGEKDPAASVEKLVIVKDEEIGMIPDLKHLYGGKEDKRGRFTWQVRHLRLSRRLELTPLLYAEQAGQAA